MLGPPQLCLPACCSPRVLQGTCHYAISGLSGSLYWVIFVPAPPSPKSGLAHLPPAAPGWGSCGKYQVLKLGLHLVLGPHNQLAASWAGGWGRRVPRLEDCCSMSVAPRDACGQAAARTWSLKKAMDERVGPACWGGQSVWEHSPAGGLEVWSLHRQAGADRAPFHPAGSSRKDMSPEDSAC